MNRIEIVVPRPSWSDVFSDDSENPLIPVVPCSTKSRKGPATMHLPCPSFLSKEWGEVQVDVKKNPIDDTKTVTLYLTADEGKSQAGEMINLVIRCKSNTTDLIISWWDYLGLGETSVITRVGNANAEQKMWSLSTNNTGTFYPGSPIAFIKSLMSADKLVAQVTPYNKSPVTAIFDIRGLTEAIKPLQETCGWK